MIILYASWPVIFKTIVLTLHIGAVLTAMFVVTILFKAPLPYHNCGTNWLQ